MEQDRTSVHAWNVTPAEAITIQKKLAGWVEETPLVKNVRTLAGVDVSVRDDRVRTAVVVLTFPELEIVEHTTWEGPVPFPYIPGLLSFREIPSILPALEQLTVEPDLYMVDGHGRAHPRRIGIATHLGVVLRKPAIGVAKSLLVGSFSDLGNEKGSRVPLIHRKETVGVVLRTRTNVHPVYVSVGNLITLGEAVDITMACTGKYRIPEPTRRAHTLSKTNRL